MSRFRVPTFLAGFLTGALIVLPSRPAAPLEPLEEVGAAPQPTGAEPPPTLRETGRSGPRESARPDPPPTRARIEAEAMPTAPLDRTCVVRARVVAAAGGAAANRSFLVRAHFGDHELSGFETTNSEGLLSFTVRGVLPPDTPGVIEIEPGRPSHGIELYVPPPRGASAALPHPLPTGSVDVGELRLQLRPLVGAGVVVDPSGQPVAGASVEFAIGRADLVPMLFDVRTDAEGRFELRVTDLVHGASIEVSKRGFVAQRKASIRIGDEGLRVILVPSGSVQGRIRCPKGSKPTVELQTSDGRVHTNPTTFWNPIRGWFRYVFRDVPTGPATLDYGRAGGRRLEAPIQIRTGGATTPPDLEIDAP